jgi:hypothetical protein
MKVHDDHLYHGAALIQIAEHPQFTAINSLKLKAKPLRSAYVINNEIAIYLKYASESVDPFSEYVFTFTKQHLKELSQIKKRVDKFFLALVCVEDREICCLSYEDLVELIKNRKSAKGASENQYTILVTVPQGQSLRVYVNAPGVKKTMLGKPLIIRRKDFPNRLFV